MAASITHHVPHFRIMNTFAILRRNAWASAEALEKAVGISSRVGLVELHDRVRWIRSYVVREIGGRLLVVETSDTAHYEPTRRFYLKYGYTAAATIPDFYADGDGMSVFTKRVSSDQ